MHAWVAHIHPFADGNGRTARALMNLILVRGGFPIVLIRRKDRARYYDSLAASDDGDIAPLLDLILHRTGDSVRQIERARAEATGISEAARRAREKYRLQYETWQQAMLLLVRSIDEYAEQLADASDGKVRIRVREYNQVTFNDYLALLQRDKRGNGWLAALRGHGYTRSSELLLWNGFRSTELARLSGKGERGGSVFISEPDPTRSKPFRPLTPDRAFPIREIAFDGGSYLVLTRDGKQVRRRRANELAADLVRAFLAHYLE